MWGLVAPARRGGAGPDEDLPVSARIALLLLESRLQPRQSETGDDSGKVVPRIRVLIATDPDIDETSASLGFTIQASQTAMPIMLRGRDKPQAGDAGAVIDLPSNIGRGSTAIEDPVLSGFLQRATHVVPAEYGYLLVYFDPGFDDPAPDGGGAWMFAYFTPAHVGYDGALVSASARRAIETAFAGLNAGGRASDRFVFTATNAAGEAVSMTHPAAPST